MHVERMILIAKKANRPRIIKNNVVIYMYNFDELSETADAYQLMNTFKNGKYMYPLYACRKNDINCKNVKTKNNKEQCCNLF